MSDPIHTQNAEEAQRARKKIATWQRLLRADHESRIAQPEIPTDALYDSFTGLPA